MKLRLEKITDGEEEILVRYRKYSPTIQAICDLLAQGQDKILAANETGHTYIKVDEVLYAESVDGRTFLYTADGLYQVSRSLKDLASCYASHGFFRCAKSMVVNIYKIQSFKSQAYGRIEATLENGEHVLISRKYANKLRQVLQEGMKDED
ncbi:LytTR family DNA-binding domain-containing protein [Streptococcus dentiloxodontae]